MWTPTTRWRYSRTGLRCASDLTDAEEALIGPLLPAACGRGRPRSWPEREIVNAIFDVLRGRHRGVAAANRRPTLADRLPLDLLR